MKQPLSFFLAAFLLFSACSKTDIERSDRKISSAAPAHTAPNPAINAAPPLMANETKQDMIGKIPDSATPIKVGLLLPLSGDSSAVGNAMLDAAMLALSDEYMAVPSSEIRSQIVLLPRDTENSSNSAVKAAEQAVAQGATFIVGPLFGQSVTAMKPFLNQHKLTTISFSNNQAVSTPDIFTFGFLPEQQVARMAEHAYLNGYTRVALLAPNEAYGQKVRDELSSAYAQKGGLVSPAELYAQNPANIDAAVGRMMAAYNNMAEDRRFQAIFIADGGHNLKNIIAAMKKNNVDLSKIKLFGTSLWDDPEITKIPEMSGTQFPNSPPEPYRVFEQRFMTAYGYKPSRLASLSYDAISLIAKISMHNPSGRINPELLTKQEGYLSPANGLFRLKEDGISERKLGIMEITPSGFKVIEPAAKLFPPQEKP